VFRRIWTPRRGRDGSNTPLPRVGHAAIDADTVARIVQTRADASSIDLRLLGVHGVDAMVSLY
jgi:hypothetical protein